jgi:hypoxanthine phosphoribosyltransferase
VTEERIGRREHGPILLSEAEIAERVQVLGAEIATDYAGRPPLLVGVLKGAFVFMADLVRAVDLDVEVDFMALSSYGRSTETSGVVRILMDLNEPVQDRHVVLVEDIVDTGLTLSYLEEHLATAGAASVEVCALLVREGRQHDASHIKYVGFELPPAFVVGYGLDASEYGRNLPYVAEHIQDL